MNLGDLATLIVAVGGFVKVVFDYRSTTKNTNDVLESIQKKLVNIESDTQETKQLALLNRDGIKHSHRYKLQQEIAEAVKRGYTTFQEVEEVTALYHSYHDLGGNGVIDTLFNKFKNLEIKGEK